MVRRQVGPLWKNEKEYGAFPAADDVFFYADLSNLAPFFFLPAVLVLLSLHHSHLIVDIPQKAENEHRAAPSCDMLSFSENTIQPSART